MKYCSKCGVQLKEKQKFCAKCGAIVEQGNITKPLAPSNEPEINTENSIDTVDNINEVIDDNIDKSAIEASKPTVEPLVPADDQPTEKIPVDEIRKNVRPVPPKNNKATVKTPPKKAIQETPTHNVTILAIILPIIIVVILIGELFGVKAYYNYLYSPKKVIEAFKQAIEEKDTNTLSSILYCDDLDYSITKSDCNAVIDYLNNNPEQFSQIIKDLNKDENILKRLKSANKSLLADNELFAITTKTSNYFFTKYAITFKPMYIQIDPHNFSGYIYINDVKASAIPEFTTMGPFLPGTYNLKLIAKDTFNNDIEDAKIVSVSDFTSDFPLEFFSDYNTYFISTNITDATLFINNKDTGKKFTDLNAGAVILKAGDEVYLSYTSNGASYKTAVSTCTSDNEYLYCDFSIEDYYAITNSYPTGSSSTSSNSNSNISDSLNSIINKYSARDYIISNSGTDKLTFRNLLPYSLQELYIAKYEIYARHGYKFTSQPNLQKFFEHKSWYHPDNQYYGDLSNVEKENYDSIRSLEFLKMAIAACPDINVDYVLPNSDTTVYSKDEINALNDWELIIARNELFARYGYEFSTEELVKYFNNKSWYYPDPSVDNSIQLNSCENDNLSLILEVENARAAAATSHDLQ